MGPRGISSRAAGNRGQERTLLVALACAWAGAIAVAVVTGSLGTAIALLAPLPTVAVPAVMFVDARREHQRLSSEITQLEAQLDRVLQSPPRLVPVMEHPRGRTWGGAPPLGHRATRGGAPTPQGLEP